jgi:hypothetical protein
VAAGSTLGQGIKIITLNKKEGNMKHFYILVIALFWISSTMAQWTVLSSGTMEWLNSVYFTDDNKQFAKWSLFCEGLG